MEAQVNQNTLNRHSPAYYQMYQKWIDALDLYEPVPGVLGRFVTKHAAEDAGEYNVRRSKATQINVLKLGIGFYQSMLFSTNVRINSKSDNEEIKAKVEAFKKKATRKGESLLEFAGKRLWPATALMGSADVFVDQPIKDPNIVSKAQENESPVEPYVYMIQALNRVQWETDECGNYTFYQSIDQIDTLVNPQFQLKQKSQYQRWTPEEIGIYNRSGQLISSRANPYGFIPAVSVVPLGSVRFFDDELGIGLTDDQIEIQKEIINTLSMVGDFHRQINFAMLVVNTDPEQGEPPTEGELKEVGTHRAMNLKGNGKAGFVSPDPAGVIAMTSYADWLITKAFQLLLIPIDSNNIKTHVSEQSIRNNLAQLYNVLTTIAKQLERVLQKIVEMALKIQGIDPEEAQIEVVWDTGFSAESFINAITEMTAYIGTFGSASPTATKEMTKQMIASKLYGSGLMDVIESEIEKWQIQNANAGTPKGNAEQHKGQMQPIDVAPVQQGSAEKKSAKPSSE